MSTSRITSANHDVKLTAGGNLAINQAVTLGTGNLTLVDTGNVTQGAAGIITAAGLQLMGAGSAHLDNSANDITTLAASFSGAISYTDASALTIGTVSDTFSGMSTSGITSTNHDVKLKAGGNRTIYHHVTLGTGNLALLDTDKATPGANALSLHAALPILGAGSAHLDNSANDITTLAASFSGAISYTDTSALTVGTVSDGFSGMSTSGITSTNHDVKQRPGATLPSIKPRP